MEGTGANLILCSATVQTDVMIRGLSQTYADTSHFYSRCTMHARTVGETGRAGFTVPEKT